ncbi:hypothetical protein HanRHA438_Chr03g0115881 [Helianthus annuus]|nr:hypothetical protein HanHA300_Chr03g0087491 [Helianthus annuus]KAJ0600259.1 hypothetical protein HanIR_Chr03g0114531 [Helianthus annuus]KAJ0607638.1 hypothetical protein HanHA89_Chr03g0099071 [Helianthus annuus]KAJ0767702.1 hypothetical protein HanLR1_Chr03g0092431 [Helianthus annuus]KAJ0773519.1 hypothetical protein HanOQP8_Chr03g0100231 [Helianthus annuus]
MKDLSLPLHTQPLNRNPNPLQSSMTMVVMTVVLVAMLHRLMFRSKVMVS